MLPIVDAYAFKHLSMDISVQFESTAVLLSTSSILFGSHEEESKRRIGKGYFYLFHIIHTIIRCNHYG